MTAVAELTTMAEMEEEPCPEAAVPAVVQAKAKSKSQGKGKAKGKGKGKAKAKGKAHVRPAGVAAAEDGVDGGETPRAKAKAKPKGLKGSIMEEYGERDLAEVMEELQSRIQEMEAQVTTLDTDSAQFDSEIAQSKADMDLKSKVVDEAMQKEKLAQEKYKAAKEFVVQVHKEVAEANSAKISEEVTLAYIEQEKQSQEKVGDLSRELEAAHKAQEEAKKAMEEAKAKHRELTEEMKKRRHEKADDAENDRVKEILEKSAAHKSSLKDAKAAGKGAMSLLNNEMKEFDQQRAERDKERMQQFREASGVAKGTKGRGRGIKRAMITDGTEASPTKVAAAGC